MPDVQAEFQLKEICAPQRQIYERKKNRAGNYAARGTRAVAAGAKHKIKRQTREDGLSEIICINQHDCAEQHDKPAGKFWLGNQTQIRKGKRGNDQEAERIPGREAGHSEIRKATARRATRQHACRGGRRFPVLRARAARVPAGSMRLTEGEERRTRRRKRGARDGAGHRRAEDARAVLRRSRRNEEFGGAGQQRR